MNIGFISTRFAGTDGVSLETSKWAAVLVSLGHTCYYFAGLCDRTADHSYVVPEAFFGHPDVQAKHAHFFGRQTRTAADTAWIHQQRHLFRDHFHHFINQFNLDLLIPENIFAIPIQIPLALALTEVIAETGIPVIAHHHDFAWERKRFLVNSVEDYLAAAFPPILPSIQHVTINTQGQQQLALRRGVPSTLIPNVMDFDNPPTTDDPYAADLRQTLGLSDDELFILQPTRVVQRKGIEHAIELVQRLNLNARLVISHASGDEGDAYEQRVRDYAQQLGVNTLFCDEHFDEERSTKDGRKIYSLWDAYPHADLVTYPSLIEGFGNALLEAIYFKKPVVINRYPVYTTDIAPKGFQFIEFDNYITAETVSATRHLLSSPDHAAEMTATNYQLALKHLSYTTLKRHLETLLDNL